MFVTIINDCQSQNDIGRQLTRYSLLFPNTNITFVGISSHLGINSTLEAAGNLIDALDASGGEEGVIAVNVAPRGQIKEDGENGSRFSYFWYKKTLVVSTIKGYNFSLIKKLKLANKIYVLDTKETVEFAAKQKLITKELANHIANSQFRSFDFQPRVAKWLTDSVKLPIDDISIDKIADAPNTPWLIDSFGNVKTTLLKENLLLLNSGPHKVKTNYGDFNFYERLKLVPDGETAIYVGSSGIGDKRFLEIATQNRSGSAAKNLNINVGDKIEIKS